MRAVLGKHQSTGDVMTWFTIVKDLNAIKNKGREFQSMLSIIENQVNILPVISKIHLYDNENK